MTGSQTLPGSCWPTTATTTTSAEITLNRHADAEPRKRHLIRQLEALGYKVTVEPAAA